MKIFEDAIIKSTEYWTRKLSSLSLHTDTKRRSLPTTPLGSPQIEKSLYGTHVRLEELSLQFDPVDNFTAFYDGRAYIRNQGSNSQERQKAIRTSQAAREISERYKELIKIPSHTIFERCTLTRDYETPGIRASIKTSWSVPTPGNYPYFTYEKTDNGILYGTRPHLSLVIDPFDCTLISLSQSWYSFKKTTVTFQKDTAIEKSKKLIFRYKKQVLEKQLTESNITESDIKKFADKLLADFTRNLGVPRAELCYLGYAKPFWSSDETKKMEMIPIDRLDWKDIAMNLVWCTRFGPPDEHTFSQSNLVILDAGSGELIHILLKPDRPPAVGQW